MKRLRQILRAVRAQMRAAWMTAMQYRLSFLGEGIVSLLWTGFTVVPLIVAYDYREGIEGWSFNECLIVVGVFIALQGILEGFIHPNLGSVVQLVRRGTLDYVLLKPLDAQLMVSVARSTPLKLPHIGVGLALAGVMAARLPDPPGPAQAGVALLLLLCATAILYSIYVFIVSTSFWFVRVDNLSFLLISVLDTGRFPVVFYTGAVRVFLTFILPVGMMTTYPALALRGLLSPRGALTALAVAAAFLLASRLVWRTAIRRYSSASS
ncbi:MAG: ABC transporter permease [Planctomycetota bacterium]|nr:MAG: ABC transporter permease [Planctomycetota bacterium]